MPADERHSLDAASTLRPDDSRHGTENGYRNLGCRCDRCKKAHADVYRERNHRLGRTRPREILLQEWAEKHGTSRYRRYGCRCEVCRAAMADEKRRYRARHPEKYKQEIAARSERRRRAREEVAA